MGSPSGLILGVLLHSVPSGTAYAVPPWVPVLRTNFHALPPAHVADCLPPPGLRRPAGSARIPYEPHTASGVRGGLLGPSGSALSAPPSPLQGLARILWPVLRTSLALPPACVADCLDPPGLRRLSPLPSVSPAGGGFRPLFRTGKGCCRVCWLWFATSAPPMLCVCSRSWLVFGVALWRRCAVFRKRSVSTRC